MEVVITPRAQRDIREIRDWIHERSPAGALRWLNALEQAIDRLAEAAASSAAAEEAAEFERDLRQLLFKTRRGNPYRLVFLIRDERIHLLTVRGTGQNLLQPGDLDYSSDE